MDTPSAALEHFCGRAGTSFSVLCTKLTGHQNFKLVYIELLLPVCGEILHHFKEEIKSLSLAVVCGYLMKIKDIRDEVFNIDSNVNKTSGEIVF